MLAAVEFTAKEFTSMFWVISSFRYSINQSINQSIIYLNQERTHITINNIAHGEVSSG